jgi:hypothetical protein
VARPSLLTEVGISGSAGPGGLYTSLVTEDWKNISLLETTRQWQRIRNPRCIPMSTMETLVLRLAGSLFDSSSGGKRAKWHASQDTSLAIGNALSVAKDSQSQVHCDESLWRLSFSALLGLFLIAAVEGNG